MKNTFGNSLLVTLFGESHGKMVGGLLDGIAPGIPVDEDFIAHKLSLRRPFGPGESARVETDDFSIVSGVKDGRTTGTPLCILIPNRDQHSEDYDPDLLRPGHADYTGYCKYHGFEDRVGGGHFSGRLTAPLVALGAIATYALRENGIFIGSHISYLGGVSDREFSQNPLEDIELLEDLRFPTLDEEAGDAMQNEILDARSRDDSLGGILETVVTGLPAGVGEPWFDSVESVLSHLLFSIPAVKGVEFGEGFGFADLPGSEANDAFCLSNRKILTETNHNGGINGGITNGMPVLFRTVFKPTPSIGQEQNTVNLRTGREETITISGRHDACILPRARVVVDSVVSLGLCDLLAVRYGTDFLNPEE
ncbi:MAG: chorismate synthase [Clostridia bacterium]|nr:chorismate synthase [Clostridia bacterium]